MSRSQLGIPLRWAFKAPERLARTNTYVVADGSLALRKHLAVQDILRADSDLRERYAAVKRRASATAATIDEMAAKNGMVQQILTAAGCPLPSRFPSTVIRFRRTTKASDSSPNLSHFLRCLGTSWGPHAPRRCRTTAVFTHVLHGAWRA